jgi:hypothetical protein
MPSEIFLDKAKSAEIFDYFGLVTVVKESQAKLLSGRNPNYFLRPATYESYDVMDFMQFICTSVTSRRRGVRARLFRE